MGERTRVRVRAIACTRACVCVRACLRARAFVRACEWVRLHARGRVRVRERACAWACARAFPLVDARGVGCLSWSHERSLLVQRTGCSWMLVDGVLSHGPMRDPYLCSARDARVCSWTGCSPVDPWAIPAYAAHMMLVYARGCSALPWPMSYPHLCSAQGARGCLWMGCSTLDPWAILA